MGSSFGRDIAFGAGALIYWFKEQDPSVGRSLKIYIMESTRQQKVARQIQKDISDIFVKEASGLLKGVMVTVTVVRVSPDLSFAKIYLSVFPFDKARQVMSTLEDNNWLVRKALGTRVKNQLKQVPELTFLLDDSLEYIDNIENLLKE